MYVGDMESQATLAGDESSANDGDLSAADKVRWKRAKLDLLAKHVVSAPTRDNYRYPTIPMSEYVTG